MWEQLKERVANLKRQDEANTRAYFILEAVQAYGHSKMLGGEEAADFLHGMGLDDSTILNIQKRFQKDPYETRRSLKETIEKSLKG